MTAPLQMFAIGADAVIGLIAMVVWIWLSVASKRKQPDRKTEPPPMMPAPGEARSPQDDLRKFFEELEKNLGGAGPAQAEEQTPPPLPPASVPRQPARKAIRPAASPVRPATVPQPAPVAAAAAISPTESSLDDSPLLAATSLRALDLTAEPAALGTHTALRQSSVPGKARLALLRSRNGLQNAIVASEVLGTPIGLRRN